MVRSSKRKQPAQSREATPDEDSTKRAKKKITPQANVARRAGTEQPLPQKIPTKTSKAAVAPVDGACPVKNSYNVFIDGDGLIYDASLTMTNINVNNNKFYYIQLLNHSSEATTYAVWTHWGRVGENGQNKLELDLTLENGKMSFCKKFKDKTGLAWDKRKDPPKNNKYTMLEKSYEEDSDAAADLGPKAPSEKPANVKVPKPKLNEELQELVRFLFDTENMQASMASQNYNFNKLPLGKLSKGTLEKGYTALKELGDVIMDPKLAKTRHHMSPTAAFNELSSDYYTIIPHDFGRNRPTPINNEKQLRAEMDLVETLGNLQISNEIIKETEIPRDLAGEAINPLDARMQSLGLQEATPLSKSSVEFDHMHKYLYHSKEGYSVLSDTTVLHIYRISRSEEIDRFIAGGYDAAGMTGKTVKDHRRLLWHGSRGCNFGGILSQGLRIAPPEAPANGKAFGKGIYLADRASKSAAYCDPWTSGQISLLLLCEAQLGDPSYVRQGHEYDAADSMRAKGLISTKMADNPYNEPRKWMNAEVAHPNLEGALMPDHSVVLPSASGFENEYIVYDIAQIKIRYVFMLKWKGSRKWGIY